LSLHDALPISPSQWLTIRFQDRFLSRFGFTTSSASIDGKKTRARKYAIVRNRPYARTKVSITGSRSITQRFDGISERKCNAICGRGSENGPEDPEKGFYPHIMELATS